MLTQSLHSAYRRAIYRITGPAGFDLRVEQHSAALAAWMRVVGHDSAAVLTAFNPGSNVRSPEENAAAQLALRAAITRRGLPFAEGQNLDPANHWQPEDSLLIGGLPLAEAHALARQFGQLAFLWSDAAAMPRLHVTAPDPAAT